ncbi:MAG: DUF4327 family protein [Synechococcales cyanobacterium RM1_1_8]|nr:DUF4327 family protein [Synechococcales cyanobacterium RM1_1_8]
MTQVRQYSIHDFQDEVRALATRGVIGRQSRIYSLCRFFDHRDWPQVEKLLESSEYLLRDNVIDLIGQETWLND